MSERIEAGAPDAAARAVAGFTPDATTRPERALLWYYAVMAAMTFVGFPAVFIPLYLKYHTLEYKFDKEGLSVSWGVLLRRETYLTYGRIQDIHVTRNIIHRWLGLSAVGIQTASGSSDAEVTIEGVRNPEAIRDYLYARMRGARDETEHPATAADEALGLLVEIRDAIRALGARQAERG